MNRTTPDPGRCIDYPIPAPTGQFPGWLGLVAQKGIGISTAAGSGAQDATR
jgi:hypothetical protein